MHLMYYVESIHIFCKDNILVNKYKWPIKRSFFLDVCEHSNHQWFFRTLYYCMVSVICLISGKPSNAMEPRRSLQMAVLHDMLESMTVTFRVYKKASNNGRITLYLGRRDFVDHVTGSDPVDGVVNIDRDFLNDKRIIVQLVCSFR